jgi:hypothetical protein
MQSAGHRRAAQLPSSIPATRAVWAAGAAPFILVGETGPLE